jgi:hypothetical protein
MPADSELPPLIDTSNFRLHEQARVSTEPAALFARPDGLKLPEIARMLEACD